MVVNIVPDGERYRQVPEDLAEAMAYSEAVRFFDSLPHHSVEFEGVDVHASGRVESDAPLIFIHGWCGSGRVWARQAPEFSRDALFVDLPGHGMSGRDIGFHSVDVLAGAVGALAGYANAARAVLIGHGLGAWVALKAALAFPDKVAGVVAVDQTLRPPPRHAWNIDAVAAQLSGSEAEAFTAKVFQALLGGRLPGAAREDVLSAMRATPGHVRLSSLTDALSLSVNGGWPSGPLSVPLAAIHGRLSPNTKRLDLSEASEDYEHYLARFAPQAALHWLARGGHFLMLDDAAAFNEKLSLALLSLLPPSHVLRFL